MLVSMRKDEGVIYLKRNISWYKKSNVGDDTNSSSYFSNNAINMHMVFPAR